MFMTLPPFWSIICMYDPPSPPSFDKNQDKVMRPESLMLFIKLHVLVVYMIVYND